MCIFCGLCGKCCSFRNLTTNPSYLAERICRRLTCPYALFGVKVKATERGGQYDTLGPEWSQFIGEQIIPNYLSSIFIYYKTQNPKYLDQTATQTSSFLEPITLRIALINIKMQQIIEQVTKLLKLNKLDQAKQFEFVQKKTGIKPSAFVLAALVFLIIVTLISNATSLVVGIGCCCVPAYFTFVVLEGGDKKQLKKYLIYWIFYAILEVLAIILIYLIPSTLYIIARIGLTVALLHPESTIAEKLFDDFILPFLRKYEQDIDKNIQNALERGKQGFKKGRQILQKEIFND